MIIDNLINNYYYVLFEMLIAVKIYILYSNDGATFGNVKFSYIFVRQWLSMNLYIWTSFQITFGLA